MEKFDGRGKSRNKNKLRNLPQYRDKTDAELDEILGQNAVSIEMSRRLEERIEDKLKQFAEDYDLSDLKINDREVLRGLIRDIIASEDYEQLLFQIRQEGVTPDNLMLLDKIQKAMFDLKKSISDAQNDLNITRKHRKSDREASVLAYVEFLKESARKFYEARMSYVYCEKCSTLLSTVWTLYPEEDNKLTFICKQKDKDGKPCGHKTTVTSKQLLANRGTNNREVTPDALL